MRNIPPTPPPRKHPVGCFSGFVVVMGIATCLWLTQTSGFGTALLENTPLFTIPLPRPFTLALVPHTPPTPDTIYAILGKPSVGAAFLNRVLAHAHSPAAGTGQVLYDLSLSSGIDDVYPLAFFQQESALGTRGMARITHSLGNLRCRSGSADACIQGYRSYSSWQAGYSDWYHLIRTVYIGQWHMVTVAQIVPVYAPASDGTTVAAYISAVEHNVTRWRGGQL